MVTHRSKDILYSTAVTLNNCDAMRNKLSSFEETYYSSLNKILLEGPQRVKHICG